MEKSSSHSFLQFNFVLYFHKKIVIITCEESSFLSFLSIATSCLIFWALLHFLKGHVRGQVIKLQRHYRGSQGVELYVIAT